MFQRKLVQERNLSIQCHPITSPLFRDILDLYLTLSGAGQWEWSDANGHAEPRQTLPRIILNLLKDIRAKYRLEGKRVIGFISSFVHYHGMEILVEAFGKLLEEFPEYRERARLLLIGDGESMPRVKERCG